METTTSTAQTAGEKQVYKQVFRTPTVERLFEIALAELGLQITSSKQLRFKQNVLLLMKHREIVPKVPLVSKMKMEAMTNQSKDLILSSMIGAAMEVTSK